jgi:mRNA-degrading endonuclease RelE of RelBE toxin-antitoxin system|tara:strand:+ start:3471 stop:3836 length:366 start_codon:yes stop_codon:yes gene_type:complete
VFQIIFNEISAAEISSLDTIDQLELLNEFKVEQEDLEKASNESHFGIIERDGTKLYRYRSKEHRIYFEVMDDSVIVHRVLHKNTLKDFLFRSKLPVSEDKALGESKNFWSMIEEGEKARRI